MAVFTPQPSFSKTKPLPLMNLPLPVQFPDTSTRELLAYKDPDAPIVRCRKLRLPRSPFTRPLTLRSLQPRCTAPSPSDNEAPAGIETDAWVDHDIATASIKKSRSRLFINQDSDNLRFKYRKRTVLVYFLIIILRGSRRN